VGLSVVGLHDTTTDKRIAPFDPDATLERIAEFANETAE